MTYVGRVNLSYGPRQTRLERLRALDEEYLRLKILTCMLKPI